MKNSKKVFVGLSGGVDSSVAALRLKKQGYEVTGVFIKVWHPDFLECNWEKERLDAMRVAAKLNIPFLTLDAEKEYKEDVAHYFISEYKAGRTPNPDVMCNKYIKFGAFLDFALKRGADYIATGHYAQIKSSRSDLELHRGVDTGKDQSYFLWTLTQDQLARILLPIGNSKKNTIRKEAEKAGLLTAEKKDSQGVCFLGHIDIPEFLSHYITLEEGKVFHENGEEIGAHKGALVYTKGQRQGFTVINHNTKRSALYVIDRNIEDNSITVSEHKPQETASKLLTLTECNFISTQPKINSILSFQSRYRQNPSTCIIQDIQEDTVTLKLQENAEGVSVGQSCVLYSGSVCLGGGIIASCLLP